LKLESEKINKFYKISIGIALMGLVGYLLQETIFILAFWDWMTQTFFCVLIPVSNFIAISSIITIFVTLSEKYNTAKIRRIAIILLLLSGMVQTANYIFSPIIDESWGIHPGETFLSTYQMYDLNFIVLVFIGLTMLITLIILLTNIKKDEEKTSEIITYIPMLIMIMIFDILCKHVTRDFFYYGIDGKSGYSFVTRLSETIFVGIIIVMLILEETTKQKKLVWIGKKLLICTYFIVLSLTVTFSTIFYIPILFYIPWTIGNFCLYLGSILLIVSTILVINDKLKEKPVKEEYLNEENFAFSNYKRREEKHQRE
jgi:hypothetical protein